MAEENKRQTEYRKKPRRKKEKYGKVVIALLLVLVLAVVFFVSGGLGVYTGSAKNKDQIASTLTRLNALAERPLPDLTVKEEAPVVKEADLPALQAEIMSHYGEYDYNSENFRRWFSDAAIVGDSVATAIKGFEWVNDVNVQAEVGIGLYTSDDVILGTEWLQPSTIFLTFSANDIASYSQYMGIDQFYEDYADIITRLQNNVPNARIFVQGILPCAPEFLEEYWYYQDLDEINERLSEVCEELGVNYYNVNFIMDAHPEDFSEDGIHPMWPFYPLWLTYMAEISGLADHTEDAEAEANEAEAEGNVQTDDDKADEGTDSAAEDADDVAYEDAAYDEVYEDSDDWYDESYDDWYDESYDEW